MGYFAATPGRPQPRPPGGLPSPPPSLLHVSTDINDNAPRGDGRAIAEPGETLTVATTWQNLTGIHDPRSTDVAGRRQRGPRDEGSAGWPAIGSSQNQTNDHPSQPRCPEQGMRDELHAYGFVSVSPDGPGQHPSQDYDVGGRRSSDDATRRAEGHPGQRDPAGVNSTFTFPNNGTSPTWTFGWGS